MIMYSCSRIYTICTAPRYLVDLTFTILRCLLLFGHIHYIFYCLWSYALVHNRSCIKVFVVNVLNRIVYSDNSSMRHVFTAAFEKITFTFEAFHT